MDHNYSLLLPRTKRVQILSTNVQNRLTVPAADGADHGVAHHPLNPRHPRTRLNPYSTEFSTCKTPARTFYPNSRHPPFCAKEGTAYISNRQVRNAIPP